MFIINVKLTRKLLQLKIHISNHRSAYSRERDKFNLFTYTYLAN